jgi:hypothetical protein
VGWQAALFIIMAWRLAMTADERKQFAKRVRDVRQAARVDSSR